MDPQTFQLFMERFDKVDADNKSIQTCVNTHIEDDDKIHLVVEKHATYWTIVLYVIGAIFMSIVGTVAASFIK